MFVGALECQGVDGEAARKHLAREAAVILVAKVDVADLELRGDGRKGERGRRGFGWLG